MSYNVWLDACGFIVLAMVILMHELRNSIRILQNTLYLINMVLICLICLFSCASFGFAGLGFGAAAMTFRILSVILGFMDGIVWIMYVTAIVNTRIDWEVWLPWLMTPFFALSVLVIGGSVSGWFFMLDRQGHVLMGPAYPVVVVIDAAVFLIGIILAVHSRRYLSRERALLIPAFFISGMIGIIIQLLQPTMQIQHFTMAVCVIIFYYSLPNPGEFYDDDSPMLNSLAFHELYNRHFEAEDTLYCVAIVIRQLRYVSTSATKERKIELEQMFRDAVLHHSRNCLVFRFKPGEYLVTIDKRDKDYVNATYRYIRYVLDTTMKDQMVGGIPLVTTTCPFVCPQDVVSIAGISSLMDHLMEEAEKRNMSEILPQALGVRSEREQRYLIHQMRNAIKENRLEIFFQPIYSPAKKMFTSAEALIRMRSDDGGFISPGVFIPLAEQNGLIIEIGDFVLDEVCRTIKKEKLWEKGIEYIEVNLSVTECIQNDLVGKVRKVLQKYDLPPNYLNLEITETASDSFSNTVDNNIRHLYEYGLSFSLDDFGTGYSSLKRILNLPLSIIKLDMSLVRMAFESENESAMTLLRSSVAIAKSVGTEIVAEGVETEEMAKGIIELGVEHIQGYFYSKPLPKEEFIELLEAQA